MHVLQTVNTYPYCRHVQSFMWTGLSVGHRYNLEISWWGWLALAVPYKLGRMGSGASTESLHSLWKRPDSVEQLSSENNSPKTLHILSDASRCLLSLELKEDFCLVNISKRGTCENTNCMGGGSRFPFCIHCEAWRKKPLRDQHLRFMKMQGW